MHLIGELCQIGQKVCQCTLYSVFIFSSCSKLVDLFTFQVYPTATRALGMGACSGVARIGAIITPFVAQVRKIKSYHVKLISIS